MPKLTNLYYLSDKNGICILLLSFFVLNSLFSQNNQNIDNKIKTIVIDPGHGGKDPGTLGTKRYNKYEKDIALSISLKLGEYIENNFPNIDVAYTRKKDIFLELKQRTEFANKLNADLFISIHCDGFTNSTASGASVFVMGMSKIKANMDVAMRENSVIYMEDNYQEKYSGFDPKSTESYIIFSLMQNAYLDQSIAFSENIEREFALRAKRKSRGIKQAPFYVISRVNMPSVLIEAGFLTNPEEEDFLHSQKGQDYIASAIFRAFRSYKQSIDIVNNSRTPSINDDDVPLIKSEFNSLDVQEQVVYRIQIGTYLESMLGVELFKKLDVEEVIENDTYKYLKGNFYDKNNADKMKESMRDKGFKGAFVVAFYKGVKISTKEALDLQNKINYYE